MPAISVYIRKAPPCHVLWTSPIGLSRPTRQPKVLAGRGFEPGSLEIVRGPSTAWEPPCDSLSYL